MRIKYNDGIWKPIVFSDKHDIRSFTVETPSGGSHRRNRRHLLKTREKCDSDFNHESEIPNYLNNDDTVLEDTNIFSAPDAPTVSPVKTPPKKDVCATAVYGDSQRTHTPLAVDVYVNPNLSNLCKIRKISFALKISPSQFRNNHVVLDTI